MNPSVAADRFFLYSDFNCPFCYALHERLHDLGLIERCEWRGVQHAPQLPRPMKPWSGSLGAELRHEVAMRSEEHTSELQSRRDLVCRLLLEKKKKNNTDTYH